MRSITHKIKYDSRSTTFRLWHLTDLHLGTVACDEALLQKHIQQIRDDPYAYWIGGGDYLDGITRAGDKRYSYASLAEWCRNEDVIDLQQERFFDLVRPIADKCLGLVKGNHEGEILKHQDRDVYRVIVRTLSDMKGVAPQQLALGVQGFVNLTFRRHAKTGASNGSGWTMTVYLHHGAGGGALPGGHALALERILGRYHCHIALLGHRHTSLVVPKAVIATRRNGEIYELQRYGIFTASYMRSFTLDDNLTPYDSYGEDKMLPPVPALGATPILLDPDGQQYHIVTTGGALLGGQANRLPTLMEQTA